MSKQIVAALAASIANADTIRSDEKFGEDAIPVGPANCAWDDPRIEIGDDGIPVSAAPTSRR